VIIGIGEKIEMALLFVSSLVIDQIKEALEKLPFKKSHLVKAVIAEMLPDIEELLNQGYSYDDLGAIFSGVSIEMTGKTLKKHCSELRSAAAKNSKRELLYSSTVKAKAAAKVSG
jgi:hypothetical protein